jgi:mannose-1-phosphate guanylyltransferase
MLTADVRQDPSPARFDVAAPDDGDIPRRVVPVIIAGGSGTRLWPISRSSHPKQFLRLTGASSLYQQTLARVSDHGIYGPPLVVTNSDYRFLAAEQALEEQVELESILLEPFGRNTAPAIAAAAAYAVRRIHPRAVLHVLPSDHSIRADGAYERAVGLAVEAARRGRHVTFGIVPTSPETGYGYIQADDVEEHGARIVKRFVEKPDQARAKELYGSGDYLWNSGMFMLRADAFLADCAELAPEVHAAATAAVEGSSLDLDFVRLDPVAFGKAPGISVDHAIFERTSKAWVVPADFAWSDLGSWDAVWKVRERDGHDNASAGSVTLSNTSRSLVVSEKAHVAVEGLDDVAVIASEDAIYVGRLSEAQKVGAMVKLLRQNNETSELTNVHRTVYRPWGGYASILSGERFQVKRLFVKPGKKLSLQRHFHRSEHWVVVRGTAEVIIDGTMTTLFENQSVYLPQGCVHRLANPGRMMLELIEVQTGSYLGEDDIVRLEDDFGR